MLRQLARPVVQGSTLLPAGRILAEVRMQFEIFTGTTAQVQADCVVIGVHEGGTLSPLAAALDRQCAGKLTRFLQSGDFTGHLGETLLLPAFPRMKAERILLVGQGRAEVNRKALRKALHTAVGALLRTRCKTAAVALTRPAPRELDDYLFARSAAEIAHGALYRVNDLKSGKKPAPPALARLK
ncbi:MAG: hypothetical protein FJ179_01980, partial [Gammaproteobacteria bacterium]|nr:hypothetical protein [Gammaproteobacteria bacterium]